MPFASEDMPFDDTVVVFRLKGRIFACLTLDRPDQIVLKCDPVRALELRTRYLSVEGAWHWNKKYWNQIQLTGELDDVLIEELVRHAYLEVNKKLPKREQVQL